MGVVLVLVLAAAGGGVWAVRTAFPQYGGQLHLAGLSAPVTVYYDAHAIPQVYAANAADLFTAQGYVQAQERFWEMDFRRHLTSGRLAEMFGSSQLETDAYLRTMGWRRVAEQEWNLVSPQTRTYLRDYANGVNAYLRTHGASAISLEYSVLKLSDPGYRIAPWDPIDSLAWLKALAWDLRGNMSDEIERASLLAAGLSRNQVEQLYPEYPYDQHSPIVTTPTPATKTAAGTASNAGTTGSGAAADDGTTTGGGSVPAGTLAAAAPVLADVDQAVRQLPDLVGDDLPGIGSNSWVISGAHTTTGKPILANDPHLEPSMPGIWYQMGLHCTCEYNVEGFTFSGVPGVVIGHNSRIAWGFTNLDPDVSDLYLEKVRGNQYEVDGQWRDLQIRRETIKVAGGKPVTLTIRTTDNGPLLSDASAELRAIGVKPDVDPSGAPASSAATPDPDAGATGYAVALRWTALEPGRTMDALFTLDKAANWDQFRDAAKMFEVPAQNLVYADVDGNIGYQSPGKIPVRGKGDGRWPAPGWDSSYDWTGYLPFDELPSEFNPPQGFIATANQAVINPADYPHFLTDDWTDGYRSQRIMDMISSTISSGSDVSVADVQRMQFDNRNGLAPALVPALLAVPQRGAAARAQGLLRGWDFQEPADGDSDSVTGRDSAAAAYFNVVWRQLLAKTFDELPADRKPDGSDRWWLVMTNLLSQPDSPWWDDKSTPKVETRDDILASAMTAATGELTKRLGSDPTSWRWGAIHTLYVQNQSLGTSGIGPIEWLFNYGPVGVSGGSNIVNATGWDPSVGYQVNAVPSMRMIVDMSNLDSSRWIQLTGESGHAFSPHYHDQLDLWRTGKTLPMRWDKAGIASSSMDSLTLKP
ncbi:penicillin acylase family protein [Rugosimonospora acidiphila]|uniref:penicillin acylase family protein n=1 Tax=Rugosimonospora acidiphila TaxID=556531 RepID=UPI003CD0B6A3